uniref:MYND-type domain-containing protein n=1 Tax=Gadus morhua TaxID=8049 RepID=A0A8C5BP58_GADMO
MLSQCGGGEPLDQGRPWLTKWTSPMWGDMRQGHGVQEWPDGSRYEGEYLNGLRHGVYSWPSGHKFTGKFYLNKKDGFGRKEFPDGSSFQVWIRTQCILKDSGNVLLFFLFSTSVNCHDAVIHLLLDTGADIDHLNCEGMNALAVCHVLYYPFQSLHTTLAEKAIPPTLSTAEPVDTMSNKTPTVCHIDPTHRELGQLYHRSLSRIGVPPRTHSHETLRRMAAMKTEHRARWSTLSLLLQRGSDPNASRLPMPVLFLAIKAAHVEAVRALLQRGAQTDRPLPAEWKGLYPLHVAAGLSGPEGPSITELLLHAMADADAQALDQEDTQTALGNKTLAPPSWGPDPEDGFPGAPPEGGRTALHLACQRDTDHSNASEVVSLLLSRRARTHLLWSGHSALSLAIASGNDMAVELLLKGGADPNLPLGRGVGSALCALTNIDYDSTGHPHDRAKMAGADIRMPVLVGEGQKRAFGTAVDYAHYTFNQDQRIAHTSYHALSQRERAVHEARGQLLRLMAAMLRQTAGRGGAGERTPPAGQYIEPYPRSLGGLSEGLCVCVSPRTPLGSCYQCGRSAFVTLTPCSRCHQVLYCSGSCKLKAWEQRHRGECIRLPDQYSSK